MAAPGKPNSGSASALTANQVVDLTSTLALLAQLRLLDATWTEQARAATNERGTARAGRVYTLGGVVDALDTGLASLADLAERLEPVFAQHADAMRREFARAMDPAGERGLTDTERTRLRDVVDARGGDFAEAVRDAASRMRQTTATETATIRTEFGGLSAGGASQGDFSSQVETDLALVAAGASVLFGPEAGVVVEGAAHLGELAYSFFSWLFS
jgi:hypothetical protein